MKLSAQELSLIMFSMRVSEEKNHMGQPMPKMFEKTDELDALSILKKVKSCIEGEGEKAVFKDGDLELTTDEKTLIKKCLDRKWTVDDLELKIALTEKLNAPVEKSKK